MSHTLHISDIKLFNLLKTKLGEAEAQQLVEYIHVEVDSSVEEKHQIKNIVNLHNELYKDFAIKEDVVSLKIAKTKNKLIIWTFIFWATHLSAIFALLIFFMK